MGPATSWAFGSSTPKAPNSGKVFADLKARGCQDILIAVTDGLKGMEEALAASALDAFEQGEWGQRLPTIVAAWRRAWARVVPFFAFHPEIRRVNYTTNAGERPRATAQNHPDARAFSE